MEGKNWKFTLQENTVYSKDSKIWMPTERKHEMIRSIHILLSHAGAEKVTKYMADNFDMNNIKESVKETIKLCKACQRSQVVTTKTKEETIKLIATEPGEKIYISRPLEKKDT